MRKQLVLKRIPKIIPAVISDIGELATAGNAVKTVGFVTHAGKAPLEKLSGGLAEINNLTNQWEIVLTAKHFDTPKAAALPARDKLIHRTISD
jgi:hypothetical protein